MDIKKFHNKSIKLNDSTNARGNEGCGPGRI